jgi:hypothetical protein
MSTRDRKSKFEKKIANLQTETARAGHCSSMRAMFVLTLSVAILTTACARVAPYERETLARRDMALGENGDLTAGEEHAEAYREGSSGGGDAKGGGCGCN